MSSPLESREGVDVLNNPRNTRPFTAPDARGGDLLTVLVHFGRHLDTLLPRDTSAGVSTAAGERLNTYVVASVGAFGASPDIVQCCRGSSVKTKELYPEGRVLYEQTCSPYAATRIVEGSTSPSWNELLAVPLPAEWPNTLSRDQHLPHQGVSAPAAVDPKTSTTTHLALKLELVERGASHQEDFLLASSVLPLTKIACQVQQKRFALAFPTGDITSTPDQVPPACIYVSLQASSRSQVSNTNALDQVEVTVESFTPIVDTGSEDEGMPLDCTSLATLINLHVDDGSNHSVPENLGVLEEQFTLLRNSEVIPELPANSTRAGRHAGLTPSSSSATGSASGVYEWIFPFSFSLPTKTNQVAPFAAVNIVLFETSSVPNKQVGRGHLELSPATGQAVRRNGLPLRYTVIPVTLVGESARVFGYIALRLRWWNAAAWGAFVADIPARRVVCTNRWKRSPRPTHAWMGALLRGLNRHPVTSICDAGGVSGVLAELLAESSSDGENKQSPQHEQHQKCVTPLNLMETTETGALLRGQLAHLQAEGTAQRVQIERLQDELDTRLAAIKTCGLEIVALRREAHQKDERLQKLNEQVDAAQHREQQQLAELLASTNASKYKELDQEYQSAKQQLADADRTVASYAALETRHTKLQEAHLVQAALVQRLQRDKQHAAALKKAVCMQEKVIRQFEQTVAQQSAEVPERSSPRQLAPAIEPLDADSGDSEAREALLRVRVRVLEQQLQTNARSAAAEMSALRLRILELETAESRRSGN